METRHTFPNVFIYYVLFIVTQYVSLIATDLFEYRLVLFNVLNIKIKHYI